jgi:aerobic-type carbon monoxide dehydrogenase small subunit (CoxS/CutS family)
MAATLKLRVNGKTHVARATADTPLLYVLRNQLGLNGPVFGCGLAQCGACSVLLGDTQIRSCVTPVGGVLGKELTTLEGLPARWASQRKMEVKPGLLHPVQQAWIDEQVPQCGYCQNGMMIEAVDLLTKKARPSDAEIRSAMNGHLCRCGTHLRIVRAIKRAGTVMGGKA